MTKPSAKCALALPDLEHAKAAVLNGPTSAGGQRTYDHANLKFVTRNTDNQTSRASPSEPSRANRATGAVPRREINDAGGGAYQRLLLYQRADRDGRGHLAACRARETDRPLVLELLL